MENRRVVITGIGFVTPIGIGKDAFWKNCLSGKSGVRKITAFDVSEYNCKIASWVDGFGAMQEMNERTWGEDERGGEGGVREARGGRGEGGGEEPEGK